MNTFTIHDWRDYQTYKDRKPKWFRVYGAIRRDLNYRAACRGIPLPTDAEMGHIIGLFCLCAEHDDPRAGGEPPRFPLDPAWVKDAAGLSSDPDFARLQALGIIECDNLLQPVTACNKNGKFCASETETETETETEERNIMSSSPQRTSTLPLVETIIAHLNKKTGAKYSAKAKSTVRQIKARIAEGRTEQDFITVINAKCEDWLADEKMRQYLRPETLFNATKMEQYLGQVGAKKVAARATRELRAYDQEEIEERRFQEAMKQQEGFK